jgi:hypothetical protein
MPSGKHVIGGGAMLAALFARFRRKPEPAPEPPPEPELEDEPWEEIEAHEVDELREDLRRELERLSMQSRGHSAEPSASGWGDIKASRTRHESASPPG